MNYIEIYESAVSPDSNLHKQTAVAGMKAAIDISNEDPATANHADRKAWAKEVMEDPCAWARKSIWKVLENATIASEPAKATDSDVQGVVNGIIDLFVKVAIMQREAKV